MRGLRGQEAKQKITGRLRRLKFGHFGDVEPVGHGVSELRIHEGKGYRVYFRQQLEVRLRQLPFSAIPASLCPDVVLRLL